MLCSPAAIVAILTSNSLSKAKPTGSTGRSECVSPRRKRLRLRRRPPSGRVPRRRHEVGAQLAQHIAGDQLIVIFAGPLAITGIVMLRSSLSA